LLFVVDVSFVFLPLRRISSLDHGWRRISLALFGDLALNGESVAFIQ